MGNVFSSSISKNHSDFYIKILGISYPINTSQWEIDYKDLRSPYLRYMIATAYSMEAISLEEAIPGNILIIGLGGGAMNNYLRHQTKNVGIFTKRSQL